MGNQAATSSGSTPHPYPPLFSPSELLHHDQHGTSVMPNVVAERLYVRLHCHVTISLHWFGVAMITMPKDPMTCSWGIDLAWDGAYFLGRAREVLAIGARQIPMVNRRARESWQALVGNPQATYYILWYTATRRFPRHLRNSTEVKIRCFPYATQDRQQVAKKDLDRHNRGLFDCGGSRVWSTM